MPSAAPTVSAPAASDSCGNGIASQIFKHGFCSCRGAIFTGGFTIDAIDSSSSGRPVSASVGVNEGLTVTGKVDIEGSLTVAGQGFWSITSSDFHVDGNLETNSDLWITGSNIGFGRDVWVNGGVSVTGEATVDGDLYQTPTNTMVGVTVGGQQLQRDFEIAEPCACGADEVLDIQAIVEAGIAQRQAAAAGDKAGEPLQIVGRGTQNVGCGRFALGSTAITGTTTLEVPGRTALFIDGDLTITGGFGIDVGTSGELDVFVSGNLIMTGSGTVGSRERPAAVRFYVGGSGSIALTGSQVFAANLYAPFSDVYVTGAQELWGSLFVGSYTATGTQSMHYDSAILRSGGGGEACEPPPSEPPPSQPPPSQPPPSGCEVDPDCPSPMVCVAGSCEFLGPE